jgi:mannose-6-phosphate isomerase-like protein (cupin superfamily)
MKMIAQVWLVASTALVLLACASTTPRPDCPATAAAPTAVVSAGTASTTETATAASQAGAKPWTAEVTHLPKNMVANAFLKGGLLYSRENYKVLAGHRDDAKKAAELHTKDTDVFYILTGSATFVTGGELVDGAPTDPDEICARSIKGGEAHKLQAGDIIIIPRGVPHQFTEVAGPFNYFVVKVR